MSKQHTSKFGWDAVPRNRSNVPSEAESKTAPIDINFEAIWPKTSVVKKADEYAKAHLPKETYNHSLRVYCYGTSQLLNNNIK